MTTTRRQTAANTGVIGTAALIGLGALAGCGSDAPVRPLTPDAFVQGRPAAAVGNPVDRPGPLVYDSAQVPRPRGDEPPDPTVREIGPTVRDSVQTPAAQATRPGNPGPATGPATPTDVATAAPPAGGSATGPTTGPGTYVNIGAVLMEVNGQAVFTDKVLTALETPLTVEAKKRNPASFRELAKALIENQIRLYKRDELEYASAERSLGPQDKALADGLTRVWRDKRITEAGGVLEVARRRAAEQGWDFDDLLKQQYRLHLIQIFYQKRVIPLINVAAADIRAYYNANKATEFTTHGAARIRVIKIDPRKYRGVREEAFAKAEQVHKRAAAEDFATLAADPQANDDARLVANAGYVVKDGWVAQGAFAVTDVDKAVFKMRPGQVSDIISADGAFYLVKVDDLKEGGTQPFEDLQVQDRIREKLRAEQFQALREKHVISLERDAITRRIESSINDALEIVMRRYPQWASAQ